MINEWKLEGKFAKLELMQRRHSYSFEIFSKKTNSNIKRNKEIINQLYLGYKETTVDLGQ